MAQSSRIRPRALLVIVISVMLLAALIGFLQRTRVIEGTWINLFEGSSFFEDKGIVSACNPNFHDAPHFAYYSNAYTRGLGEAGESKMQGVFVSKHGHWPIDAYSVKFVGHHQILGFGFGHMSTHPSEYVVDRIISIKLIPRAQCDIRPA